MVGLGPTLKRIGSGAIPIIPMLTIQQYHYQHNFDNLLQGFERVERIELS